MHRQFALPGTRPRWAPDRIVDVEHYELDLRLDVEKKRIDGTCAITVSPILDGARHLELDAVELEIRGVTVGSGTALDYSHDGKKLRVDLGPGRRAGEKLTLSIRYGGAPRRGLYFVGPDEGYPSRPTQVWSQGQDEDSRHWFPCFDAPLEKATSAVRATVPATWFALSNGALVETTQPDARSKTYHWRFDVPHSCYLVTLAAGELVEQKDRWEDIDVSYYCAPGREADTRRALGRTPEMLSLFSEKFGVRYPYGKYAQVFVAEFIFGGMENTTATTLTDACLYDARAALDYDVEALVAHELAHQWFGDLLTCRDWGQGWLNEGFATYSEYLWREHAHGRDEAALELADWADQYFGEDERRYRRTVATNLFDEPIDFFDHHLYEKGGLVLHMLRRVLGDEQFFRTLGHYVRKHRTGSVETRDLARAVEEATGRNLDWFFDQWIHKAGHPELKVELGWDAATGRARLLVKQSQKVEGETPLFRLPTQVRFRVNGQDETFAVEIKDDAEVFFFPLAAEPTQAIFDPGQHTLKRAKVEKPQAYWLAELAGATEAVDRAAAARVLSKHASAEVIGALAKAVEGDAFWGVRGAAAAALGAMRIPAARDALVAALPRAKHPKARRAVVRALGEFRHDDVAARALEPIVTGGDESYFVEAEAGLALGRTRTERAPVALRRALQRDSYLDVVRQYAYRGLAEARDESALPLLLDGSRYGRISQGRRAAVLALAHLVEARQDLPAKQVREHLQELLGDRDFRVQQASIEALESLGDARAIPALSRVVERELDGRLRRRAREVIRDLQEGRAQTETIKDLRDEMDKVKRELLSLRERLVKLEPVQVTKVAAPAKSKSKPAPKPAAKTPVKKAPRRR